MVMHPASLEAESWAVVQADAPWQEGSMLPWEIKEQARRAYSAWARNRDRTKVKSSVALPRHPAFLCLLYLSNDVASPFLQTHLALVARMCRAIALRFEESLNSLGCNLKVLSPTTKLYSRHQQTHVLHGENSEDNKALTAILPPSPYSTFVFHQLPFSDFFLSRWFL
jgi:hypothetical protein